MKNVKRLFACLLSALLLAGMPITADTMETVSVESASLSYAEDDDTVILEFTLAAPEQVGKLAVILATEEVLTVDADALSKILCIDQITAPADGRVTLTFPRVRAEQLLGTTELEGTSLCLRLGEKTADAPTTVVIPFAAPEIKLLVGDVNGDGTVSALDALALLHMVLNGETAGLDMRVADMNGDGKASLADVLRILTYSAMH